MVAKKKPTPKKKPAAKNPISIKPSKVGSLHKAMGVKQDKPLSTASLNKQLAAAKASGNTAMVKKLVFALNARKWKKG